MKNYKKHVNSCWRIGISMGLISLLLYGCGGTDEVEPNSLTADESTVISKIMKIYLNAINEGDSSQLETITTHPIEYFLPQKVINKKTELSVESSDIKKIDSSTYEVSSNEVITFDKDVSEKRDSTYILKNLSNQLMIDSIETEYEEPILYQEQSLIKEDRTIYETTHGNVRVIGQNIDNELNHFSIAIEYDGTKPEEFVHTFTAPEIKNAPYHQNKNFYQILAPITTNGIRLTPSSFEIIRTDDNVIVIYEGDALGETDIARVDYIDQGDLMNCVNGIHLDDRDYRYRSFSVMENSGETTEIPATRTIHGNLNESIEISDEDLQIEIEIISYDPYTGLLVEGSVTSPIDRQLNIKGDTYYESDDTINVVEDKIQVYTPYLYYNSYFDKIEYETDLYAGIPSKFSLQKKITLSEYTPILKLNLYNIIIYFDLENGVCKEYDFEQTEGFEALETVPNFVE